MNEQNLKPFKKGHSGNPKGRPRGKQSITSLLKRIINKRMNIRCDYTNELKNMSFAEMIVLSLVNRAINGDIRAIREVLDRVDGKVGFEGCGSGEEPARPSLGKEEIDKVVNDCINS